MSEAPLPDNRTPKDEGTPAPKRPVSSEIGALRKQPETLTAPEKGPWLREVKFWIEGVFGPLARAVPAPLAALALVVLYAILRLGERFSPAVAYVAMGVVAIVSILYFYFYQKQGQTQLHQAEDEAARKSRQLEAVTTAPALEGVVWSRLQVKLNLPDQSLDEIRKKVLERIHEAAFTWLSDKVPRLTKQAVRINVMLPDNRRASYGEVCQLFIPRRLHINMDDAPDKEIRFSLTQGLVGKVYTASAPGIAVFKDGVWKRIYFGKPEPKDPNEPDFELTEWQKKLIHPDLRWVLSLPLLYKEADKDALALGVLDIDCIGFEADPNYIKELTIVLAELVLLLAATLGEKPKERISILQQEPT